MKLKLATYASMSNARCNRTILELKLVKADMYPGVKLCCNRTILELKLTSMEKEGRDGECCNRTILELKLFYKDEKGVKDYRCNRTILELKRMDCGRKRSRACAVIAPFWN